MKTTRSPAGLHQPSGERSRGRSPTHGNHTRFRLRRAASIPSHTGRGQPDVRLQTFDENADTRLSIHEGERSASEKRRRRILQFEYVRKREHSTDNSRHSPASHYCSLSRARRVLRSCRGGRHAAGTRVTPRRNSYFGQWPQVFASFKATGSLPSRIPISGVASRFPACIWLKCAAEGVVSSIDDLKRDDIPDEELFENGSIAETRRDQHRSFSQKVSGIRRYSDGGQTRACRCAGSGSFTERP